MKTAFESLFRQLDGSQGISILSAPAGLGKTLLSRILADQLERTAHVAFLPNAQFSTPRSLLQAVLYELGEPYSRMGEQELRLALHASIKDGYAQERGFTLIVDEAHLLDERILEEIRSLTNFGEDGQLGVSVLLSGQLSLEEKLAAPGLEALNQRIVCHATLDYLSQSESVDYVEYRVAQAGGEAAEIFSPDAFRTICRASDGVPRCLNQLCDHSLMLAMAAGETPVSDATARLALDELKQLPLHWNEPPPENNSIEPICEQEPSPGDVCNEPPPPAATFNESDACATIEVGGESTSDSVIDADPTDAVMTAPAVEREESECAESSDVFEFGFEADDSPAEFPLEDAEIDATIEIAGDWAESGIDPEQPETDVVATTQTQPAPEVLDDDDQWEWESVDLIAEPQLTESIPSPNIAPGMSASIPEIAGDIADPLLQTTATWAAGLPEDESVTDHYAALESRIATAERSMGGRFATSNLECQTTFVGVESSTEVEMSEEERLLRDLLSDPAENAPRPVAIVDRVTLLMQDLAGLGLGETLESSKARTGSFDTATCSPAEPDAILQTGSPGIESAIDAFDDDRSTIAFQVAPRLGITNDFDMPSQIVIEPGLGNAGGETLDDIHATLADTLLETRQLIETVSAALNTRRGLGDLRTATDTSSYDAVLRSPYFANLSGDGDSEIEAYDIVMPESDDIEGGERASMKPPRFSTLFSDLNRDATV